MPIYELPHAHYAPYRGRIKGTETRMDKAKEFAWRMAYNVGLRPLIKSAGQIFAAGAGGRMAYNKGVKPLMKSAGQILAAGGGGRKLYNYYDSKRYAKRRTFPKKRQALVRTRISGRLKKRPKARKRGSHYLSRKRRY